MASYQSRRYNIDAEGNVSVRETEEAVARRERRIFAGNRLRSNGKQLSTMSTGGWRMVGSKSMKVFPRGTIICKNFGVHGWIMGVVTESRVLKVDSDSYERWYTITYEDDDEEELDHAEVAATLVCRS